MQTETNAKEIAVITIHGMGREDVEYYKGFEAGLQRKLGEKWERVAFGHIYYQDTLEPNEQFVYDQMHKANTPFRSFVLWRLLREFLLFYFADPGSLETNKASKESAYYQTQTKIVDELRRIYAELGRNQKTKVLIAAHSLGCQVISSYIWDAQYASDEVEAGKRTHVGYWGRIGSLENADLNEIDFLKLTSLQQLFTCGCNIPLFTAGHNYIVPFKRPNPGFKWMNYYSRNDVLGYPMAPLRGRKELKDPYYSDHPTYAELVEDHEIRAGNLLQFWNPLAHSGYLTDDHFLDPIAQEIESLLP
jgi:hypothetical protein